MKKTFLLLLLVLKHLIAAGAIKTALVHKSLDSCNSVVAYNIGIWVKRSCIMRVMQWALALGDANPSDGSTYTPEQWFSNSAQWHTGMPWRGCRCGANVWEKVHFPEISPGYFHLKIYPCTIKNRMVSKGSQVRSGTGWESEPSEGDWIYVLCTELPTFMSPAKRIKWQVMGKAFTYDSERQILVPADIWLYEPTVWLIWKGLHEENFVQRQDRRDKMGNKIIWMPFSYITTKQGNFL